MSPETQGAAPMGDVSSPSLPRRGPLGRIGAALREFGWGAGLLYLADQALSRLSPRCRLHVYDLMVQPVPAEPLLPTRRASKLEIREVPHGAPEMARMPARAEVLQARARQGATCLGAFRGDEMIGYMWFCWGPYEEDEARCTYVFDPAAGAVFDFDFYLFPEHRMGTGFVALWNGANAYLRARGVRATYSRMTRFNLASRRAHRHLGCRRVGQAWFLQLGAFQAMLSTLAPYVDLSLRADAKVHLQIDRASLPVSPTPTPPPV